MPRLSKIDRITYFKNHSIREGIHLNTYYFYTDRKGWNGHVMYCSNNKRFKRTFNTDGKNWNLKLKLRKWKKPSILHQI